METTSRLSKLTRWIKQRKKVLLPALGIILGASAGFAYYYFVGCSSGTCPITSSPWASMGMGTLMGLALTVNTGDKRE